MAKQIVCVGDSITFGLNVGRASYPSQLQLLLSGTFKVTNLGVSGSTACSTGLFAQPYTQFPQWQEALNCATPDICIFMLGTNDSHKNLYNDGEFLAAFKDEYKQILKALKSKYERLIVMIPPPCLNDNGDHRSDILKKWAQLIPELANGLELSIVNLFEAFGADSPHKGYYMDNVHPNQEGYKVIAESLRDILLQ
jgi:lysophospholipase L1-like esterase